MDAGFDDNAAVDLQSRVGGDGACCERREERDAEAASAAPGYRAPLMGAASDVWETSREAEASGKSTKERVSPEQSAAKRSNAPLAPGPIAVDTS